MATQVKALSSFDQKHLAVKIIALQVFRACFLSHANNKNFKWLLLLLPYPRMMI